MFSYIIRYILERWTWSIRLYMNSSIISYLVMMGEMYKDMMPLYGVRKFSRTEALRIFVFSFDSVIINLNMLQKDHLSPIKGDAKVKAYYGFSLKTVYIALCMCVWICVRASVRLCVSLCVDCFICVLVEDCMFLYLHVYHPSLCMFVWEGWIVLFCVTHIRILLLT